MMPFQDVFVLCSLTELLGLNLMDFGIGEFDFLFEKGFPKVT